jgi:hypothetical protein
MREALSVSVVAVLLIATLIDVVAAGVKTSIVRNHFYYAAAASGVSMALPSDMKNFSAELLPQ